MARALFLLLAVFTIGWSAYWYLGSTAQEKGLEAWLAERQAAGWVSEYSDLRVKGYPNRFDAVVTDLNLADPKTGWAWIAPSFQILALSYQPNHVIAVWPPEQSVATPEERITVANDRMRASVKFEPNSSLALSAATMEMENLSLASNAGWTSALKSAQLSTRQTAGTPFSHDIFFTADQVKPARILKAFVDPQNSMPDVFDSLRVDITAAFDAPWDRKAVEGDTPEITALNIKDFVATWGELDFQANGAVTLDRAGYPTGKISVRAKNWKAMLDLGVQSGLVPSELQGTLQSGLGLLARLSGNPDTIDAPLSFKNGVMSLGPIPIGTAPRIKIGKR